MNVVKYIGSQFSNPRGFGGRLSTYFMNLLNTRQYTAVTGLFLKLKPDTILDIGFGNGRLLKKLAKNSHAKFYGIEVSEDMLRQAEQTCAKAAAGGNIKLRYGDVVDLGFDDASFSFAYTVNTVYFWPDLQKGYSEIQRVLKKGGVFANVFYAKEWLNKLSYTNYGFAKYSPEELVHEVNKMGFAGVKLMEIQKEKSYCLLVRK